MTAVVSAYAAADVIDLSKLKERNEPIICMSHLRWNFVFQRPQHLMTRFAKTRPVMVFEEPLPAEPGAAMGVDVRVCSDTRVIVVTPRVPSRPSGTR
ncbi:MAG TPA: hypothetical protein VFF48_10840, partial [Brevundimonas sp.]|nr:hypothetical protein [Brevundimonas sp.]